MAASTLDLQIHLLHARTEREIETVFASLPRMQLGGLVIGANAFYFMFLPRRLLMTETPDPTRTSRPAGQ